MVGATRAAAELLFGRPCRLPLAAWVRSHDKRFIQSRPPTFDTIYGPQIKQELERLTRADMLIREKPESKVFYEMTDSPLWEVVDVAVRVSGLAWRDDRLIW